jgi:hypothetical protein
MTLGPTQANGTDADWIGRLRGEKRREAAISAEQFHFPFNSAVEFQFTTLNGEWPLSPTRA